MSAGQMSGGQMSGGALSLRPMRWWDVQALMPIERALFGAAAWTAETFWSELARPQSRWYTVAHDVDGDLLGYAGLMFSGAEADVQTMAVALSVQRRGIGSTLLVATIAQAARAGATSLLLEVRADNAAAIDLYRRHGFERIALRRGYYQPEGVDAWIMRLRPVPAP